MAHEAYSPVGYDYRAEHYCLDCIAAVVAPDYLTAYIQADGCNCTECVLDRIADDRGAISYYYYDGDDVLEPTPHYRGIDRHDEASYDMGDFPKHIPYPNEIHIECGPESYGYGPEDPEWREQYCDATCARCHSVIDGSEYYDGEGHWETVCPVWLNRKEEGFK